MTDRESLVFVGRVGKAHGLKGEVLVWTDSDFGDRFQPGSRFRTDHASHVELEIDRRRRTGKGGLIVHFVGIDDRNAAEGLRGAGLFILPDERRPLEPGEFWPDQLIGLEVRVGDRAVGAVGSVDLEAAQTRIEVVQPEGGRALVPFVEELVPVVDLAAGYLQVVDLPGLLTPDGDSA